MNRGRAWIVSAVIGTLLLTGCTSPAEYFLLPEKQTKGNEAQESGEPGTAGASIAGLIGDRDSEKNEGFDSPEEAVLAFLEAIQTGNTEAVVAMYPDEAVDYIAEKQNDTPEEWRERMESAFTKKKWPFDAYEIAEMTELEEEEIQNTYFSGYEPEQAYRATISLEKSGKKLEDTPNLYAAKYGEKWYVAPTGW